MYLGDYTLGDTIDFKFTTRRFSTGAPYTLAGTPSLAAYPNNSTTEVTAGITLTVDFDARTGLNHVRVVATSGNGYADATEYEIVIAAGTVDSVSVVGEVVARFTLGRAASYARLGAPAGASVSADLAAVKSDTAAILTDTADMQPKLGTPAADIAADIAAVKSDTAAILTDTGTDGVVVAAASKTGYALSAAGVSAVQSGLSTYDGSDTAGTTTLLSRLSATRAGYLDSLAGLTFTVAGKLDVNLYYVNGVQITGTGALGDEWGPA